MRPRTIIGPFAVQLMQLVTKGPKPYATEKRIVEENNQPEHSDRTESWTEPAPSSSDRVLSGAQEQER